MILYFGWSYISELHVALLSTTGAIQLLSGKESISAQAPETVLPAWSAFLRRLVHHTGHFSRLNKSSKI